MLSYYQEANIMWTPKPKREFDTLKKSKLDTQARKELLPRHVYKKLKRHNDTLMTQLQESPVVIKVDKATQALFKEKFGETPKVDVSVPEYAYVEHVPYANRVHKQKVKPKSKAMPKQHYTTFVKTYL